MAFNTQSIPSLLLSRPSPSPKPYLLILTATAYAVLVVAILPWEAISREGFPDFEGSVDYFDYFKDSTESAASIFEFSSPLQFLIREVLWFELIRFLTSLTGNTAISLRLVSFFILFVFGYLLPKRAGFGASLLFLFNPSLIDIAMSGIRNGFAWALVLIGLSSRSNLIKVTLFVVGTLTHSATLLIVVIYYAVVVANRYLRGRKVLIAGIGVGVVLGLAVTIGNELLLGAIGDRRVGDEYVRGSGALLAPSIWAILLFFQATSNKEYVRRNIFVIALLSLYLPMSQFIPWAYRIWGCFLPLIVESARQLSASKRQLFLFLYSCYFVAQYFYWSNLFNYWH